MLVKCGASEIRLCRPHLRRRAVEGVAVAGHQVRGHVVGQEDALVVVLQLVGRVVGLRQPGAIVRDGLQGSIAKCELSSTLLALVLGCRSHTTHQTML